MITVVTGWSPAGYVEYGRRFAETFDKFWPKDVNLVVYGEEPCELARGEFRLLSSIPGCMEFLARHDNPIARGMQPAPGKVWKPKNIAQGYNFRFDAWKFCRQGFIPYHAVNSLRSGQYQFLCWLDGDVVTHNKIPTGFIEDLLPTFDHDIAYLGRGLKHSEIGFQLYRLDNAFVRSFLFEFSQLYATDSIFLLKEWHSAYAWDSVRRMLELNRVKFHDLTPGGTGHVWHQSPLRVYMDHLKGDRKQKGRSDERIG